MLSLYDASFIKPSIWIAYVNSRRFFIRPMGRRIAHSLKFYNRSINSIFDSKIFFSDFINRKFLKKIQKLKSYFHKNDIEFMLLIRLVPILTYFAQNLLLAVIGTTVFKFYFTTVIGQLPWSIIYASIGSGINSLTFEDINLFEEVFNNPKYLFPIIFILLLIMISFYFRKKISKFRE